jgi:secreted trypsin-like serine protease
MLTLGDPNGRKAHHIPRIKTILSLDPTTIATHLPGTQYAVNVTFGNTLESSKKEVINTLAGVVRIHLYPLDGCADRAGIHGVIIAVSPIKLMISLSVVIVARGGL